jgi:hypothetical protein
MWYDISMTKLVQLLPCSLNTILSCMTLVFLHSPLGFTPSPRGQASKRKKTGVNMALGVRASKRVRAYQGSKVQPPQSQTRTSKRLHLWETQGQSEEETPQRSCTPAKSGNGAGVQDTTTAEGDSGGAAQHTTCVDEDNVHEHEDTEGKL